MKSSCHKCNAETEFNKNDYIGIVSKQSFEIIIKMETLSHFPKHKRQILSHV